MSKDDYHKNALKTSWNDVTGDFIRTGKGGNEKYAAGWDAVFGKGSDDLYEIGPSVMESRKMLEWASAGYGKLSQEQQVHNTAILKGLFDTLVEKPLTRCAANREGDCYHKQCPQLRNNEPAWSGRSCPLDDWRDGDAD